nr:uncharacterized protein LOC117278319 [Nicotiana tomentosiformis]
MGEPQATMPDQVQEQGVQDAPQLVPIVVPTVALPVDVVARLLNVLEALVPTQDGNSSPQATLQTQETAQTHTFENKEVSVQEFLKLKSPKFIGSALHALGCSSERAVELAAYKLEDMANTWYETVLLGRTGGAAPLTWDEFMPTEEARAQRFVDGLVGRLYTAVAPWMKTLSYSDAVDLAKKIETKGRDERATSDLRKKSKTGGSFNGDLS